MNSSVGSLSKKILRIFQGFAAAALISAIFAACLVWFQMREPKIGGDFQLKHRDHSWVFSENAPKLNLLYIGYAKCPDVCPLSLSHAGQAFRGLNEPQKKKTRLIFISVDFEHDNPQAVADYAAQFYPEFIGLSGDETEIRKAVDLFSASFVVEKNPKSYLGYSIAHTDRLFFLDSDGIVVDSIPNPRSAEDILNKIKEHL